MSNRENLRRIAALSLVIAFGMSGAAGLADATNVIPAEGQEEPVKKETPLKLTCDVSNFDYNYNKSVNGSIYAYNYFETIEIVDGKKFTLNIKPFWHFDNGEALDYSIESLDDSVSVNRDASECNIT